MTDRRKDTLSHDDFDAPRQAPKRRGHGLRSAMIMVLVLALVLGAVLVAAYWDLNNFDSLRRALTYDKVTRSEESQDLFTYDNDRTNQFARLGEHLLVVSSTRISLLSQKGEEVYSQAVKFDAPAVSVGGKTAAVYDVGGSELYLLSEKGLLRDMSEAANNGILSARLNSSDFLAVSSEKSGYKANVSVYNASGDLIFSFNSSNQYILDACCERDGKYVSVVAVGEASGSFESTLYRYALDQTNPVSTCKLTDSLLYEVSGIGSTVVAVTDDRFVALSADGSLAGEYSYAYPYLRGYTLGGIDFGALVLSRYRSGSAGKLVTVGTSGNMLASLSTQRDVLAVSAAGHYLAVLYSDELIIYTSDLTEYATLSDTRYAKGVIMREDGSALLLGASSAWLFVP